jgi:hypothetical protein
VSATLRTDLMLKGYGERPEELSWYLATAILCRSPHPLVRAAERVDA